MKKVINVLGMTLGGWLGWAVGSVLSFFAAYLISVVGIAAGLYFARRFSAAYLP